MKLSWKWIICLIISIILILAFFLGFLHWILDRNTNDSSKFVAFHFFLGFSIQFGSNMKINVVDSAPEIVEYEVVILPNRAEFFGRLRLKLPTVLASPLTPVFYLCSTTHQVTYRGIVRNQTLYTSSFERLRPKKVIQNHITMVHRFETADIKNLQEKLYTKTHLLISSSPNGSFYNIFLYKTFTVVTNLKKVEDGFKAVARMSMYQKKRGLLSVLEEDILYDDFTL